MKSFIWVMVVMLFLSVVGSTTGCTPKETMTSAEYLDHGGVLFNEGKYDEAILEFNKAIELDPKYTDAYFNRGIAYIKKGQYDLAIADFSKVIELDPKGSLIYILRGDAYFNSGQFDLAIVDYNKVIELSSNNAHAYFSRGVAYAQEGLIDLAAADLKKVIELSRNPDEIEYARNVLEQLGVTTSPSGDTTSPSDVTTYPGGVGYEYWKGDIPNVCYILNWDGERALKLTGKPFMVLTYNKITHEIIDFEFGLSEVVQEGLSTKSGDPVFGEPTLDAENFNYREKLDLKSPVLILVGWDVSLPGYTSIKSITNGVQNFSTRSDKEEWYFNYTSSLMEGDVKNFDYDLHSGRESESKAFKLMKKSE